MPVIIESLRHDHRNMEQMLLVLEREISILDRAEQPDFAVLNGVIEYFRSYASNCHHPKEDLVYAKLKARDGERASAISDVEADHLASVHRLTRFAKMVEDVLNEQEIPRQALDAAATDFIVCERLHIQIEEREFLPAALESLTVEDWAEIDARLASSENPLFCRETAASMEELSERIASWEQEDQAERAWISQGRS